MYDNYNNNFNNNPKPLFSNEFNNLENNSFNVNPSGVDNLNQVSQMPFNNSNTSFDLPPELEPIKDMNQVDLIQAPTKDVLSPMNIMPENNSVPMDKLDNYDMGINTYDNMNPMNNFVNSSNDLENSQSIESYNTNNFQNSNIYGNYSMDTNQYNNVTPDYSSIIPTNDNEFSHDYNLNIPQNNIVTPDVSGVGVFQNDNTTINNDIYNQVPNINEYENNGIENSNADYSVENEAQTTTDEQYFVNDDIRLTKEEISNIEEKEINNSEENQESISNDIKLESSDNDYIETDVLDIIDIDEEQEENQKTENEEQSLPTQEEDEEKPLITKNIEEIKELIDKLKEKGLKIEIDEFDFEHMYQLIVKIEK